MLLLFLITTGLMLTVPSLSMAQDAPGGAVDVDSDSGGNSDTAGNTVSDSDSGGKGTSAADTPVASSAGGDVGSSASVGGKVDADPAASSGPLPVPKTVEERPEVTSDEESREGTSDNGQNGEQAASPKKKKNKKKKLTVSARIYTYWQLKHEDTPDDPLTDANEFEDNKVENKFDIRHARFKMTWRPEKWLTAVLQLGDFQDLEFGFALLRDAYIHVSPFRFLEIRAGQFKKPFSRLSLRSIGKLEVINRGEGDKFLVEDLRYGDRDLGVQFSGRIIPSVELDYEVGFFNGSGPDISEQGNSKDIVARLSIFPLKWFDFGVNGSFKFFDKAENPDKWAKAFGVDAVFKAAGFKAQLEHLFGFDYNFRSRAPVLVDKAPAAFNLIGIFSYKREFSGKIKTAVEPVFKFEYFDPNAKVVNDHVLVFSPGFNSYFGKYLRLMIAGEILRSTINSATQYPKQEVLTLQLCFDI